VCGKLVNLVENVVADCSATTQVTVDYRRGRGQDRARRVTTLNGNTPSHRAVREKKSQRIRKSNRPSNEITRSNWAIAAGSAHRSDARIQAVRNPIDHDCQR
jgi:hypothetical protein